MKFLLSAFLSLFLGVNTMADKVDNIYDIEVVNIDGKKVSMSKYKDRVLLIVNVASECAFTSQYIGLEMLHKEYSDLGLSILGFPCNQFLSQEPATEQEIQNFCYSNYGVEFDMFSKINVNGDDTHPLYVYLKEKAGGFITDSIKWNFTKFLVDRKGNVIKRYAPSTKPKDIEKDIQKLL